MNIARLKETITHMDPAYIEKYIRIMDMVHATDVSQNIDFQRLYKGYYRVRRNNAFTDKYFSFMECNKHKGVSFDDTLHYFYNDLGRLEASFSSKLVATIDPEMPIWDKVVLGHLKLSGPKYYSKNRVHEAINIYNHICSWYRDIINSEDGKRLLETFDIIFSYPSLSSTKKIDFILWQTRETA